MVVYVDKTGKWLNEISIVISDSNRIFHGTWIEDEYIIGDEDPLYEPFKEYFMKQLEKTLFMV